MKLKERGNKKIKKIFKFKILIIVIALISSAMIIIRINEKKENLVLINKSELQKHIESKDDFLLYIGSDDCKYCVKYKPDLIKFLEKEKKSVYYLNLTLNNKQRNEMRTYLYSMNIKYIPVVVEVKDGKIVEILDGTSQEKEIEEKIKNI